MKLEVGARASFRRVLLQEDFDRFARLTGDNNPIHCDPEYARHTHFGATVSHGMLLYGLLAKALSELIPGPGVRQLTQELTFPNPTFTGEEIEIQLEVLSVLPGGALKLGTRVSKGGGSLTTCRAQASPFLPGRLACAEGISLVLPQGATEPPPLSQAAAAPEAGDPALYGLAPGQCASATRKFGADDLAAYGDLVGDRNPLFRGSPAQVPGPLLAGMFSDLLGTRLPGRGTGWMKQRLQFLSPAPPEVALTASVEITRLRAAKELVNLATRIVAPGGRMVVEGDALVLVRNLENKLPR